MKERVCHNNAATGNGNIVSVCVCW